MTLSVVIPAHGRPELVTRCLVSLRGELQPDVAYDVCVVDDGSGLSEDTVRAEARPDYPLAWRALPGRRGRSAARNEGVAATTGDVVVFLDSDMEACGGMLAAHAAFHDAHPRTAAVGAIHWPRGGSFLRYIGSRGVKKLPQEGDVPPWYFVTGNASVARDDLPDGPPFDESLPGWGGEDLDLGLRLRDSGVAFGYAADAVSIHNFDGGLDGHLARTFEYGRRTLPVLAVRHPSIPAIVRLDLLDRTAWRLLAGDMVFRPVYGLARLFDRLPLPMSMFDYLTWAAYARGWMEGTRS